MEIILTWKPFPWLFGNIGCHFMVIGTEASAYISILTMMAFTFERFTAVCYPLRPSLHSGLTRTKCIIGLIWITSLIFASPWINYINLHPHEEIDVIFVCGINRKTFGIGSAWLTTATSLVLFIIPVTVLPIAYYKIYKSMQSSSILTAVSSGSEMQNRNRYIVFRTQGNTFGAFF